MPWDILTLFDAHIMSCTDRVAELSRVACLGPIGVAFRLFGMFSRIVRDMSRDCVQVYWVGSAVVSDMGSGTVAST